RLKCLARLLVNKFLGRQFAQLLVNQRQELFRDGRIALFDGGQDAGDLCHSGKYMQSTDRRKHVATAEDQAVRALVVSMSHRPTHPSAGDSGGSEPRFPSEGDGRTGPMSNSPPPPQLVEAVPYRFGPRKATANPLSATERSSMWQPCKVSPWSSRRNSRANARDAPGVKPVARAVVEETLHLLRPTMHDMRMMQLETRKQ